MNSRRTQETTGIDAFESVGFLQAVCNGLAKAEEAARAGHRREKDGVERELKQRERERERERREVGKPHDAATAVSQRDDSR